MWRRRKESQLQDQIRFDQSRGVHGARYGWYADAHLTAAAIVRRKAESERIKLMRLHAQKSIVLQRFARSIIARRILSLAHKQIEKERQIVGNFLLKISIATLFFLFILAARYSVIPKNFPPKKCFIDIGPLINPTLLFFLTRLRAILKDCSI